MYPYSISIIVHLFVRSQVLLPERNSSQSGRPEAGVPVCRRSQRHRRNRLFWRIRMCVNLKTTKDLVIMIYIVILIIAVAIL